MILGWVHGLGCNAAGRLLLSGKAKITRNYTTPGSCKSHDTADCSAGGIPLTALEWDWVFCFLFYPVKTACGSGRKGQLSLLSTLSLSLFIPLTQPPVLPQKSTCYPGTSQPQSRQGWSQHSDLQTSSKKNAPECTDAKRAL